MNIRKFFISNMHVLVGLCIIWLFPTVVFSQASTSAEADSNARKIRPLNLTKDKVFLDGYDVVAYFKDQKPIKGKEQFSYKWEGVEWYFSSREYRDLFMADPYLYVPQYGGNCAYAASRGYIATIDPDAWTIHKGKLYLNFSKSVRRTWQRNIEENIVKGDKNWPSL